MRIGLDVGSTTIKAVVVSNEGKLLFSSYERHLSRVVPQAAQLLETISKRFPHEKSFSLAVSGSAGMGLSEHCGIPFVQEVYATRVCADQLVPGADVIIELGGEDAKILFLGDSPDARMNGSCAGGTGAFIDQMATLLGLTPLELNEKAEKKEKIYSIASRCGVFAKSDVQPLLNQGARVEDVAASIFYAVVNQTVAGLAQGRSLGGRVVYLGGPLTFFTQLRAAFDHVLDTKGILPQNSLYFVSIGSALLAKQNFDIGELIEALNQHQASATFEHTEPLFQNQQEYDAFALRHARAAVPVADLAGYKGRAHLGIDAGSTTVKTALIAQDGTLLHTSYQPNSGNPVPLVVKTMREIYAACPWIELASVTTTGYGEQLCKTAVNADFDVVETIAHFMAASHFNPQVDFIIDIGGQDMKCFKIEDGVVSDIFLNEACSSGCGSFLQTFAEAMGFGVQDFAKKGLFGDAPVELGSRCTVFMNSSVKQAQKDGASVENISAGLAISVVKNALYKVIRLSSPEDLGRHVVVQGGTFHNDAVLRAFEKELGIQVIRPSIAGLMGAFGAALYGRAQIENQKSGALGPDALAELTHQVATAKCGLCTNQCTLTVNRFSGGRKYISGNRCERPNTRQAPDEGLNLYAYKRTLLAGCKPVPGKRGKIGIPMGLNMYEMLPFWHAIFSDLGFEVVTSPESTRMLYYKGQATIPSDTVCYPAKLMHGHIRALCETEGVDTIFYPCLTYNIDEKLGDNHFNCPVVAYYPEVIRASCAELADKRFLYDYFGVHRPRDFAKKLYGSLREAFAGITRSEVQHAVDEGYRAYEAYLAAVREQGARIIQEATRKGMPVVVLAGRPYHADAEVNHGIDRLILSHGAAVVSEEAVSHLQEKMPAGILNQWTYHARLFSAAHIVAENPNLHLVQLVSFGCGLDAVTTDEVREILHKSGRLYTQIKIDEIANLGAVNIRLRSLFAAIQMQGRGQDARKEAI